MRRKHRPSKSDLRRIQRQLSKFARAQGRGSGGIRSEHKALMIPRVVLKAGG